MDWAKKTRDPLDSRVKNEIRICLLKMTEVFPGSLVDYFCNKSKAKRVLHVGCFEHDEKYFKSPKWKHRKIDSSSSYCVGVDINEDGVNIMKKEGYQAICLDATGDGFVNEHFDIIIVGDVIEHITNVHGLVSFCKRHLGEAGSIIISTPNPFYIGNVLPSWFGLVSVVNFEHTSWFSESNILEICRRYDLKLSSIVYPIGNSSRNFLFALIKKLFYIMKSSMLFTTTVYEIKRY